MHSFCGFLSFSSELTVSFSFIWQIRFPHLLETLKCHSTFTHATFSNCIFPLRGERCVTRNAGKWALAFCQRNTAGKVPYWCYLNKTHYINGLSIYEFEELWHKKKSICKGADAICLCWFQMVLETYIQENVKFKASNKIFFMHWSILGLLGFFPPLLDFFQACGKKTSKINSFSYNTRL